MKLAQALGLTVGDVVAFTGGGGKTTAMFQLADELVHLTNDQRPTTNDQRPTTNDQRMRVLMTTSTRIFAAQIKRSPAYVTFNPEQQTMASLLPRLEAALDQHGQVLLIGQAEPESGKAFGIPPEIIDTLAATGRFDFVINEADGSRMRSFKAPATHEPVIPASTSLVTPIVGLDVLGQPLGDTTVHRAALVSQLSGTRLNEPVTEDTITTVLGHAQGGLKNVPAQARVVPLLNKVETPARLAVAQRIAAKLLAKKRIEAVAIGAVQRADQVISEVWGRTAAIILAAGGSTRFGSPKQLARWGDQTFIEQVVDVALASQARPVIVVLGAEVEQSQTVLGDRPVQVVINEAWAEGQSRSMQAGLAALPQTVNSTLFLPVDLPGITPKIIEALIERYRQTMAPVVWPEFEGQRGQPVLFDRSLFAELNQVRGDTGGRAVLMAHKEQAERVTVTDKAILQDVDRPEDLERVR